MNKKTLFAILAVLCFLASWFMHKNAKGHTEELKNFWWVPLPLGILALLAVIKDEKKKSQ
jgi:hypothetical protein